MEMTKLIKMGELIHEHVVPEIRQLQPDDLTVPVRLELHPNVRGFLDKDGELGKFMSIVDMTITKFPQFVMTHPEGVLEMLRRVYEMADIKGIDAIFESDKNQPITGGQPLEGNNGRKKENRRVAA